MSETVMVRIDPRSKSVIARAARLRGVSASDYVRLVVLAQARRDVDEAESRTMTLSPEDQLAFWTALQEARPLTKKQRELGRIMRGRT